MDLNKFRFSYNTRLIGIIENLMGFKPCVGYDVWDVLIREITRPSKTYELNLLELELIYCLL